MRQIIFCLKHFSAQTQNSPFGVQYNVSTSANRRAEQLRQLLLLQQGHLDAEQSFRSYNSQQQQQQMLPFSQMKFGAAGTSADFQQQQRMNSPLQSFNEQFQGQHLNGSALTTLFPSRFTFLLKDLKKAFVNFPRSALSFKKLFKHGK